MNAESGYYFVSTVTAVTFVEKLNPSLLSIELEEFNNFMSGKKR
jgi:hypothetical protein